MISSACSAWRFWRQKLVDASAAGGQPPELTAEALAEQIALPLFGALFVLALRDPV
jgi:hypothetical protein